VVVTESIFTKFILQHIFVKTCFREFHEYSKNGLVSNTRSDSGRGFHVRRRSSQTLQKVGLINHSVDFVCICVCVCVCPCSFLSLNQLTEFYGTWF